MSGLARFFCLSSSRGARDDWGHSDHYGGAQYVSAQWGARAGLGRLGGSGTLLTARVRHRPAAPRPPTLSATPPQGAAGGMAKVLEVLEEDLDHRLGGAHVGFQGLGSVPLRRLYKSGLPPREQQLCKELLSKVAALDQAREAAEEVRRGRCRCVARCRS